MGGLSSPLSNDVSEKFSDNQWLTIIKNKKIHCNDLIAFRKNSESSHETFARQYEHTGLKNPERFVALAMQFPGDVDRHYLQAVWSIASAIEAPKDVKDWKPAKFDTLCKVIERFLFHHDAGEYNMCCSFCRLIRDKANEDWPAVIIDRLVSLAFDYKDLFLEDHEASDDLETASLNCVRGTAVNALSAFLWENQERYDNMVPIIDRLVQDGYAIVRFAALELVIAYYNINPDQAITWFFSLTDSDERIARHYRTREIFFRIWNQYKTECINLIHRLFFSEDDKSSEAGAILSSYLYVVYDGGVDAFQPMMFSGALTEAQIKGCTEVAVELMDYTDYHEQAKTVVEELTKYPAVVKDKLDRLFYRDGLRLPQDYELIIKIVSISPNESFSALSHYIRKNDAPTLNFINIVMHLCTQYIERKENVDSLYKNRYYSVMHELPTLISAIYDQAIGDKELTNKCLDMWDALYQYNIGNMREITRQIMDR